MTRRSTDGYLGGMGMVVAAVVVVCLVLAGSGVVAAGVQSEETTTSNVSSSVDAAQAQNDRVSSLAGLADGTVVQYLAGIGLGAGVGLCLGGIVMYEHQSRRIEDTFE
ncbi:hypothetical protein [Halorubellus sp. PRR65]|uniref:hypothetical protein n=1 Tax=Halorubellus sp. PRR65 TaxID=3098148 RepID=UPI002B25D534|nr:hypothetical protein [Halorubellus sp. PRR65]